MQAENKKVSIFHVDFEVSQMGSQFLHSEKVINLMILLEDQCQYSSN